MTPKTVLPLFFTIGIIFAPIGGLLLYASAKVQEIRLDYTNCRDQAPTYNDGNGFLAMPSDSIETAFKTSGAHVNAEWAVEKDLVITNKQGVDIKTTRCYLRFTLPEDLAPPVLFYYHLTNFYQNHRRYVESFDAQQLKGDKRSYDNIHNSKCTPLFGDKAGNKPYYPCGLIANSMFNDTYRSPEWLTPANTSSGHTETYLMENNTNIAWSSDKDLYGKSKYEPSDVLPPPNWKDRFPNNYTTDNPPPDLENWQAFQVWMRTAALPAFSKLYQRNDHDIMKKGQYEILIEDCMCTFSMSQQRLY